MNPKNKIKTGGALRLADLLIICGLLTVMASTRGGQQIALNNETVLGASTNLYNLYGASTNAGYLNPSGNNPFFDGTKSTRMHIQFTATIKNTQAANDTNVIVRLAGSSDVVNWTNNAVVMTITATANSTNSYTRIVTITDPLPAYAPQAIECLGGVLQVTNAYLKAYTPNGL